MEGRFLLSYNDCAEIRRLYSIPGITIESTTRLNNIAQRYEGGAQYAELLIANYDTAEILHGGRQITLTDLFDESQQVLNERKIIWNSR